jgi:uncharacterized membrane protein
MLYLTIKFLHILLAIVAIGFNASYGIWIARAARSPGELGFALRGVKVLDDRFANPAYILLLVTGLAMSFLAGYPLTTFWIMAALILLVVALIVAYAVYTPTLRRQIAALETSGPDSDEYRRLARWGQIVGIALGVAVLLILLLMVFKPTF